MHHQSLTPIPRFRLQFEGNLSDMSTKTDNNTKSRIRFLPESRRERYYLLAGIPLPFLFQGMLILERWMRYSPFGDYDIPRYCLYFIPMIIWPISFLVLLVVSWLLVIDGGRKTPSCSKSAFLKHASPVFVSVSVVIWFPLHWNSGMENYIRNRAYDKAIAKSQPLIAAIEKYAGQHGNPPDTLNDLVPEFLEEIPSSGMKIYPFTYINVAARREKLEHLDERFDFKGNPWVLYVSGANGNYPGKVMYFPNKNVSLSSRVISSYGEKPRGWAMTNYYEK